MNATAVLKSKPGFSRVGAPALQPCRITCGVLGLRTPRRLQTIPPPPQNSQRLDATGGKSSALIKSQAEDKAFGCFFPGNADFFTPSAGSAAPLIATAASWTAAPSPNRPARIETAFLSTQGQSSGFR
jgi:hypothetical protein